MAIAIHTKDQLKNNTVEEALGTNNVRILYKNNRGTFQGIEIFIITERIDPADFSEGPALAIDISLAFLEKLANNRRITDLIYKPWSDEELEKYLDSFESYLI